jgi:signal transduction histidine kinase
MPEGGRILIEVSAGDHLVTVHFDDEGQGIPNENLEKIWDPFFTTKEMGTGLGLGIVKNIIESHGGSIQIVNRPVRGARVTIEFQIVNRPVRGARVTIELPLKQKVDDTEDVSATVADSN